MRDLRRINNNRLSVRTVNVLKALNIKTIGKAKQFANNWTGETQTNVSRFKVTQKVINEILNFK